MTHHPVIIRHISISGMLKCRKYVKLGIHEIYSISKNTVQATQIPSLNGGRGRLLSFKDRAQEKPYIRKPKLKGTYTIGFEL